MRYEIVGTIPAPGTPLGVVPLPNGKDLAVARFEGGGHKYWLLEQLRERGDIEVLELGEFLPG